MEAPMYDAKRPWRKLSSHPVNLVQALVEDCRKGLISPEDKDAAVARLEESAHAFNAAAKVVQAINLRLPANTTSTPHVQSS